MENIPSTYLNPFGGLKDEEVMEVLSPEYDLEVLSQKIRKAENTVFEFIGKHGRGKTTHLRGLAQLLSVDEMSYYDPESGYDFTEAKDILLIDSFHFLSIFAQFRVLRRHRGAIVHTDHFRRKLQYLLCGKKSQTLRFGDINGEKLRGIICNRVLLFAKDTSAIPEISLSHCQDLVAVFGNDYRGIMYFLYRKYNKL